MPATIIYSDKTTIVPSASPQRDDLWLSTSDLTRATGWELKPQGACLGERCVPLPQGREADFIRSNGDFNLATFARHLDQPVAHDDQHAVWSFGQAPEAIAGQLHSLEAPDFTLPDLDGKMHSLSDYRGKKVLLLSWASW
jgi:hypothetical protein